MNMLRRFVFLILLSLVCHAFAQVDKSNSKLKLVSKEVEKNSWSKETKYGYVDERGNVVVPIKYTVLKEFGNNGQPALAKESWYSYDKWGYVDIKGKEITPFKYDMAFPFIDNNLALVGVKVGEDDFSKKTIYKFGYIDVLGKEAISLKYGMAYPFSDGLAAVVEDRKYGFINEKKQTILGFEYDDVKWGFIDSYAWVKKGKKWGMINKSGATRVNFQYSRLSKFDPETGFADAVAKKGEIHYYDAKGNKFDSAKAREEANKPKMPIIEWQNVPVRTTEKMFALKAEIKSKTVVEYCNVYLNGLEVQEDNAPGGSSLVEDPKGQESYNITINRTLVLREGENTIRIKVKNAGGEKEDEKTMEFKPNRPVQEKALIVWNDFPSNTIEEHLELDATVKSTMKDVVCRVLLNGAEMMTGTKGSSIVQDSKEIEFKYKLTVIRTLILQEGDNTVKIEVLNAKGKLLKSEQKKITYVKPMLATIEWGEVPPKTEEEEFALKAQIKSDCEIESYSVTLNGIRKKSSYIVKDNHNISIDEVFNLREGDNIFIIEVKNKAGEVVEEKHITYTPKEKRIALVIGNANYQNIRFPKLVKTKEDARAMYSLFESLGFDMMPIVLDADLKTMRESINEFVDKVGKDHYDVALLYYSGHGLSPDGGANYFIPIDAHIEYLDEVKDNALNSQIDLIAKLKEKDNCRVKIALLDCCNSCAVPPRGAKSGAYSGRITDLLKEPTVGISVIHAALPTQDAIEGDGKVSPFVEAFLECVEEYPNAEWPLFIDKFKNLVHILTDGKQTPYPEGGFIGKPFYLNPRHQ